MGLRVNHRVVVSLSLMAGSVTLAACGSVNHVSSSTTIAAATTTLPSRATYTEAISELRHYLVAWRREGPIKASSQYLEADQRVSRPPIIHLLEGTVVSYRPYSWTSGATFSALVKMNLRFRGSSGAWNNGINDRYVAFTWSPTKGRYLMDFYTGL